MLDQVGNPEDQFSHNEAHIVNNNGENQRHFCSLFGKQN